MTGASHQGTPRIASEEGNIGQQEVRRLAGDAGGLGEVQDIDEIVGGQE